MTQPTATIIAACIAVAAAAITLFGVWLNIRHQTKLDDRKACREREETRRQERMTLFAEVLSLAAQANRMVWTKLNKRTTDSVIRRSDKPSSSEEFSNVVDVLSMSSFRLELLGYPAQALALDKYNAKLVEAWATPGRSAAADNAEEQAEVVKAVAVGRKELVDSLKAAGAVKMPAFE